MSRLNKNCLYILSVKNNSKFNLFAKLIKYISSKNTINKIIVNHTALLFYHNNEWLIAETGFFLQNSAFKASPINEYYTTNIGRITLKEKQYILNKYNKMSINSKLLTIAYVITTILLSYPYPLFNALPSFEFRGKYRFLTDIIDKIFVVIFEIQFFITSKILKLSYIPYCTESVVDTILEIDNLRKGDKLKISDQFLEIFKEEGYKTNEIYPQQIVETMKQIKIGNL